MKSDAGCEKVKRITHETQNPQIREVAEDLSQDICELVAVLLRDGKGERSEAAIDVAGGEAERDDEWRNVDARGGEGGLGRITHDRQRNEHRAARQRAVRDDRKSLRILQMRCTGAGRA